MLKMEEKRKLKLEDKKEYKQLCKNIKKSCRKTREKYYEDKCKELEELDAKHSPRFFTKIKEIRRKNYAKSGLRTKEGQIIQDDEGIVRWYEYIAELYNNDRRDVPEIFTEEVVDLKPYIPEAEILDAIWQLPKGKAVGEDNVPAEFSQNVGEKGKRMIVKLINKIFQTGELPADFLANIFVPIPKTSNTTKCEEHQTISLISHACKILLYIIKNRIMTIINEHLKESQFGFREGSGTRNAIYVLRTIGQRMMQKKKKVYICFIDNPKAFGNVKHKKLIRMMKQVGITKNETETITNLYFRQVARVQCNAGLIPEFKIRNGVRQGCILYPILFNLYSEMLIKEAMDEEDRIKINEKTISTIRYEDDTAVVAPTQDILQRMMDKIILACKNYGMKLNVKKTKVTKEGVKKKIQK